MELTENDQTFAGAKLFFNYGTDGNLLFPWYLGELRQIGLDKDRFIACYFSAQDTF